MRGDLMVRPGGVSSLSYSHTTRFRWRALRVLIDGHALRSSCFFTLLVWDSGWIPIAFWDTSPPPSPSSSNLGAHI
ncbi:hypothetical protein TorRG33x02_080500 [Trema orientale]|uniref:Uncharacterized protein n=1 Tax=Trema orientale TaxID=63057 RepID=A0A2P5FE90_TREOI|nr:hypothetical protein TorRG33x02_080500 [Trema orientale]